MKEGSTQPGLVISACPLVPTTERLLLPPPLAYRLLRKSGGRPPASKPVLQTLAEGRRPEPVKLSSPAALSTGAGGWGGGVESGVLPGSWGLGDHGPGQGLV